MNDTSTGPDHSALFELASEQAGYFTSSQARACGFSWAVLTHHVRGGRFSRIRRGLYRLTDYPSSPREDVMAAWLAVGKETAVVSHESALDLLGLSDVVPERVHISVPRARRGRSKLPGVRLHTTKTPPGSEETTVVDGVRVTSPARSIADAAAAGTSPEHMLAAARQALARGMVTPAQLERAARRRGPSVHRLVREAIEAVGVP